MVGGDDSIGRLYWRQAAAILSIEVVVPFEFAAVDGSLHRTTAFIPGFGSPRGTAAMALVELDDSRVFDGLYAATRGTGLYCSIMCVSVEFNLAEFREALVDWGYFGPSPTPAWISS